MESCSRFVLLSPFLFTTVQLINTLILQQLLLQCNIVVYCILKYRKDAARALIGQKLIFYQSIKHRKSVFYCFARVKSIF